MDHYLMKLNESQTLSVMARMLFPLEGFFNWSFTFIRKSRLRKIMASVVAQKVDYGLGRL
jgi:hypothetical protein